MPSKLPATLTWARSRARALPYVARRDEKIRELLAERKTAAKQLAVARKELAAVDARSVDSPSYRRHVFAERRIHSHMGEHNYPDRGNLVAPKLKGYSFAQSHGVSIPQIFGIWDEPEDIDWDELPDSVVIKSNTGSTSRGVFPLRRIDGEWRKVTSADAITPAEIVGRLRSLTQDRRIAGPFFAEELLGGGVDNALPVDVKVHAFYGEVGHVLLRNASDHGNTGSNTFRTILQDGTDAGPIHWKWDDSIPIPKNLDEIIEVAKRLSLCIRRAFIRVDMYDVEGRIVFGELTPRPGGSQDFGPEHDERLGHLWEQAHARVLNDVIDGADYSLRFGAESQELRVGEDFVPGWPSPTKT